MCRKTIDIGNLKIDNEVDLVFRCSSDPMKRSWFSALIIAGVIGLLTLFLGLQYMWLTEVSEATRDRMH
jgi:hypothetical protein